MPPTFSSPRSKALSAASPSKTNCAIPIGKPTDAAPVTPTSGIHGLRLELHFSMGKGAYMKGDDMVLTPLRSPLAPRNVYRSAPDDDEAIQQIRRMTKQVKAVILLQTKMRVHLLGGVRSRQTPNITNLAPDEPERMDSALANAIVAAAINEAVRTVDDAEIVDICNVVVARAVARALAEVEPPSQKDVVQAALNEQFLALNDLNVSSGHRTGPAGRRRHTMTNADKILMLLLFGIFMTFIVQPLMADGGAFKKMLKPTDHQMMHNLNAEILLADLHAEMLIASAFAFHLQ